VLTIENLGKLRASRPPKTVLALAAFIEAKKYTLYFEFVQFAVDLSGSGESNKAILVAFDLGDSQQFKSSH
jgi:hypothetical protein